MARKMTPEVAAILIKEEDKLRAMTNDPAKFPLLAQMKDAVETVIKQAHEQRRRAH